jgi:ribosome maturation factor RimP
MIELLAESGQNPLFRFEGCIFTHSVQDFSIISGNYAYFLKAYLYAPCYDRQVVSVAFFGGVRLNTAQKVEQLLKQPVADLGYELCDVEFIKEYGDWVLTLFIDKDGGVNIDDCERVSRAVDPLLDEADPIEQAYMLSVSSLGLDRPLKKDADFARNIGKRVEIKLFAPKDGKKEFKGELAGFDENSIVVLLVSGELTLERKAIALVRPELKF